MGKACIGAWSMLILAAATRPAETPVSVTVRPDKIVFDEAEPCTFQVQVENTGPSSRTLRLTAYVEYEIDTREDLLARDVTVAAAGRETIPLVWKPGRSVLGCGVVVEAAEGGRCLARHAEYFNVIKRTDIARVGICGQLRVSGGDNPTERAYNRFFVEEGLRKGYINIAEAHGLYADALVRLTPTEEELKKDFFPGGFPFWISGTRDQLQVMKANGIATTAYAFPLTNSRAGLELGRARPDLMIRLERGQASFMQFDVKELEDEKNFTPQGYKLLATGWIPDQTSRETLDIGVAALIKARTFWGLDGVRWDGHYSPRFYHVFQGCQFFTYKGEPVPGRDPVQLDRLVAANMRYVKDALRKAFPDYLFMANYIWPEDMPPDKPSEEYAVMLERGGAACNESIRLCSTQGHPYNRWAEMSRRLVFEADKAEQYGGYVYAYPEPPWSVTVPVVRIQYPLLYATRNRPWFAAAVYNHFMAGHPDRVDKRWLAYSEATRPICRFATRYSAVLFGYGLIRVKDPAPLIEVSGPRPLWWKDYVHTRPLDRGARQITVDLFNPPPQECLRSNADETDLPAPQADIAVFCRPAAGQRVAGAWYLSPEIDGMQMALAPQPAPNGVKVVVPRLSQWGIVVFTIQPE